MSTNPNQEHRVFDNSHSALVDLFEQYPKGVIFTCPVCGVELLVVLSKEESKEKQIHPGIYCPTDPSHVWQMFNLSGSPRKE